jgi:hypothetical protein
MKYLLLAASLLAVGSTSASAQLFSGGGGHGGGWHRDHHPYAQRHHGVCQSKAIRLHDYESRALRNDGRLDRRERATLEALRNDLDRTCGRYRHR